MRRTAVGLGLLAAACLTLSACGSTSTPTAPATQVPPATALNNALAVLKTTGYDVTTKDAQSGGTGSVNPGSASAAIQEAGVVDGNPVTIAAIEISANRWVKLVLGALGTQAGLDPSKWYQVDPAKLSGPDAWPFDLSGPDAFGVSGALASTANVQRTSPTQLTGTVDLTQATGPAKPSADELSKAGAAAKTTPFTATLDAQGRLASLVINADGFDKDLTKTIAFANYGSPSPISAPPAADVVAAPPVVYTILNGG